VTAPARPLHPLGAVGVLALVAGLLAWLWDGQWRWAVTGAVVILLAALLTAATVRMLAGHWMPVRSQHEPLDFVRLTIAGIPVEEIGLDQREIDDEKWHLNWYLIGAQWRLGLWATRPTNLIDFTAP
jgi:hypothetical protein